MMHALVVAQDLITAACGTLNALYFTYYWLRRRLSRRRRIGAAALVSVNAALVIESLFFLSLYVSWHWRQAAEQFLWPPLWLTVRLPLLVGAAFTSVLVLRALRRR